MNPNSKQFKTAYRLFYAEQRSLDDLLTVADSVCSTRLPLHGCLFGLNLQVEDVRNRLQEGRRKLRGFKVSGTNILRIEVPPSPIDRLPHHGTAKGFLLFNPQDYIACLIGFTSDLEYLWAEFRRYMRSDITSFFLRTKEFKQAFQHLCRTKSPQFVCVKGFTANVLFEDGQRVKTRREWLPTAKPVMEFFAELEEERQWLRSIEVVVNGYPTATGRIRRDMAFSCQSGFRFFLKTVVESVRLTAAANRGIFQHRSVSDSPTHASRPLQISYPTRVFDDKQQNRRLIRVIRRLSDSGISVFHPNPFLHASVVDYTDGSTYTIWITDSSAIKIIPGLKASAQSLGRLCNHINEHFEEGAVEEIGG